MILEDSEVLTRLNSPDNILNLVERTELIENKLEVRPLNPDVGKRGAEIGEEVRKLISRLANESDESQKDIADVFGVSQPLVSQVSRGLVNNRLDADLAELSVKTVAEKTNAAHELALDSLVATLGIVKAKLPEIESITSAATMAERMSRVVGRLKDSAEDANKPRTLVIVTMPSIKKESHFETIDV